ncbi:MAG: hypothetical protein AABZ70_10365 [candidate division NC10 bacterium]
MPCVPSEMPPSTSRLVPGSRRMADGWRMVGCGSDIGYVTCGAKAAREALRTG